MTKQPRFPKGWDESRVKRVIEHYESQSEAEAIAEDEAALALKDQTLMEAPNDLVPIGSSPSSATRLRSVAPNRGVRRRGLRMTRDQAIRLIRRRGVVLESARGEEPSFAEKIAGGPISGGWWSHAKGHEIFELTQRVRASKAILVCGLANGRITYVHRRLWPYFVRMADRLPQGALDNIIEVHTPSGRHRRQEIPYPDWVPENVLLCAQAISRQQAAEAVRIWIERYGSSTGKD